MNPYTKNTTPNSPSFTDGKRGGNSVKDMSVSLTNIPYPDNLNCEICKGFCRRDDMDGLGYFDCWNFVLKKRESSKE